MDLAKIKALVERLEKPSKLADKNGNCFAGISWSAHAEALEILRPLADGKHVVVSRELLMEVVTKCSFFAGYVQGRWPDDDELQEHGQNADAAIDALAASQKEGE